MVLLSSCIYATLYSAMSISPLVGLSVGRFICNTIFLCLRVVFALIPRAVLNSSVIPSLTLPSRTRLHRNALLLTLYSPLKTFSRRHGYMVIHGFQSREILGEVLGEVLGSSGDVKGHFGLAAAEVTISPYHRNWSRTDKQTHGRTDRQN